MLPHCWKAWKRALVIVKVETVVAEVRESQ
jgi:hypothetical protein